MKKYIMTALAFVSLLSMDTLLFMMNTPDVVVFVFSSMGGWFIYDVYKYFKQQEMNNN